MKTFNKIITLFFFLFSFSSFANTAINELMAEAKWGNDLASYKLARAYDTGNGVEEDKAEAIKWYTKSANQNNASAQIALGLKYAIGKDIEKDIESAYVWFKMAELNKHQVGQSYREKAQKEMTEEQLKASEERFRTMSAKISN